MRCEKQSLTTGVSLGGHRRIFRGFGCGKFIVMTVKGTTPERAGLSSCDRRCGLFYDLSGTCPNSLGFGGAARGRTVDLF